MLFSSICLVKLSKNPCPKARWAIQEVFLKTTVCLLVSLKLFFRIVCSYGTMDTYNIIFETLPKPSKNGIINACISNYMEILFPYISVKSNQTSATLSAKIKPHKVNISIFTRTESMSLTYEQHGIKHFYKRRPTLVIIWQHIKHTTNF